MMTRAPPTAKAKTSAKMLMGESLADPPVAAGDTAVVQECSTLVTATAFVPRQDNSRHNGSMFCCITLILLILLLLYYHTVLRL